LLEQTISHNLARINLLWYGLASNYIFKSEKEVRMTKMLSMRDMLEIALEVNVELNGRVGQAPLFRLVQWVDERMGMDQNKRRGEIEVLVSYARREAVNGARTYDAVSFDIVDERFTGALNAVERAVAKARKE
ncbi:MAG: hypothetical protein UX26_C0026G0001, partial [Parcubacteria group bacterium GW2011_GWC1_45_9]